MSAAKDLRRTPHLNLPPSSTINQPVTSYRLAPIPFPRDLRYLLFLAFAKHLETFLHHLFRLAYQAGALGLFCVGVLDSSFLFVPLGNDFLMLGLSARHHDRVPFYVMAATLGSVCGILLTLWVSKKGGEKLAKKRGRAWKYVESQMRKNAGWALTLGSLMPPPFPFTLFVAAAGALRVPLKKVLPYVAAGRFVRFTIEGVLAILYDRWILSLANSPALKMTMVAMIVIAIAGSAFSIVSWVRR